MIISHQLKYVYIGIPRTGSKSMNRWLMDHFHGEWFGAHHDWQVPDEAKHYLTSVLVKLPVKPAADSNPKKVWWIDGSKQSAHKQR